MASRITLQYASMMRYASDALAEAGLPGLAADLRLLASDFAMGDNRVAWRKQSNEFVAMLIESCTVTQDSAQAEALMKAYASLKAV